MNLQGLGPVQLAGIRTPTTNLPDCFTFTPASHLRGLLPRETRVRVEILNDGATRPRAFIFKEDGRLVNRELVQGGWSKVLPCKECSERDEELRDLQKLAQERKVGLWRDCSAVDLVSDFEVTGGQNSDLSVQMGTPPNPGDTKNCRDFQYFEEAKDYYEAYFPFYGDVARLDRRGDGIPCRGLPHTPFRDRYQMKVPANSKGQ